VKKKNVFFFAEYNTRYIPDQQMQKKSHAPILYQENPAPPIMEWAQEDNYVEIGPYARTKTFPY